jgi:hypothetical protein
MFGSFAAEFAESKALEVIKQESHGLERTSGMTRRHLASPRNLTNVVANF